MRDWRGIRAEIGDRVFYATTDGARKPRLHEAWVEEVGETHIRVRPAGPGQITSSIGPSSRIRRPEWSCEHSRSVENSAWTVRSQCED
jgi:hypothetical protein